MTENEIFAALRDLRAQNEVLHGRIRQLESLVYVDPLTEVGNRRAFDSALRVELERTKRTSMPTCLLLVDLIQLKRINDSLGHHAGDSALKRIAACLVAATRRVDSVHRIGGDEFAAVLCSSDLQGGERVVQRFRQLLEASTDGELDDFYVNARIGLAVALRGGEIAELESDALRAKRRDVSGGVDKAMDVEQTAVQLIATADKALYADGAC